MTRAFYTTSRAKNKKRSLAYFFCSYGLNNSAGADAASASFDAFYFTGGKLSADFLQVGHETSLGLVVSMRNVVACLRTFTAYIAYLGHVVPP
jgi:hypothetical protein